MSEVGSNALNFADVKNRAVSSKSYRSVLPSTNGQSFNLNNVMEFALPSGVRNSYFDGQSVYLKASVQNANANNACKFEGSGFYSLINKLEILSGGTVLQTIDQYSTLVDMMLDAESSDAYKDNTGKILCGMDKSKIAGAELQANNGNTVTVAVPLILSLFHMSNRMIPSFSNDVIRIRITLNTAQNGLISSVENSDVADTDITLSNVSLCVYMCELSQSAQDLVDEMTGGVYDIVCDDFRNASSTIDAGVTTHTATLGFSFSSLNRCYVCHRPSASLTNNFAASQGNRSQNKLTETKFVINGINYPQRNLVDTATAGGDTASGAELLAESLICDRSLSVFAHDNSLHSANETFLLNDGNGQTDATCGRYYYQVDFESVRGDTDKMYAGLSTLGATVQISNNYATTSSAHRLDVFAQYSQNIRLDMNSAGVFTTAV